MEALPLYIFLLVISPCVAVLQTEQENTDECSQAENIEPKTSAWKYYPLGDPRFCLQGIYKDMLRMEVLPGTGWDNLRNLNKGIVASKNYSQCLTSEDGKFLIPDNTYVVPLKESNVALNSEYFDHWNNYSSMTSKSINVGAHASFSHFSLGGKFSSEYESVKKHQVEDKAITTRVQLRYKLYTVKSQPDFQLHPDFKSRLLDVAANLQCNNTAMARYLADLIVRDYGTHYITSIEAGAILAKVDHIKDNYASTYQMDKRKITASASASFFSTFGFSGSSTKQSKTSDLKTYLENVAHSRIQTHGGPPYRENFSVNQWEDGLMNNLIAIDRSGDPLHFAITPYSVPELPQPLAFELRGLVLKSLRAYYNHNSIKGCTDANSPNFNFQAVLDDHSCDAKDTNFTFGGVYQTCAVSGSPSTDPCGSFTQKNPKTADYTCPLGYTAVLVHRGLTPTSCHRECHGWWFFKHCHNDCGYASYEAYWCVDTGAVKDRSGYLFGGLYSKVSGNPLTGTQTCPPKFHPQRFGPEGMYVCISDDYELAAKYSVPFAGFFSCTTGNPLTLNKRLAQLSNGQGLVNQIYNEGPSKWPKHCPTGFSQHLAIIDEDCEINYCVKANYLAEQELPTAKLPPFRPAPKMNYNITIPLVIVNDDTGRVYFKDPSSYTWMMATKSTVMKHLAENEVTKSEQSASKRSKDNGSMTTGSAVGLTIGLIALVALLVSAVVIGMRRKKRLPLNDPLLYSKTYQSVADPVNQTDIKT